MTLAVDKLHAAVFGVHYHSCPSDYCKGTESPCSDPYDCQPGDRLCFTCYLMKEPFDEEEDLT